jgi:hypothetical protein
LSSFLSQKSKNAGKKESPNSFLFSAFTAKKNISFLSYEIGRKSKPLISLTYFADMPIKTQMRFRGPEKERGTCPPLPSIPLSEFFFSSFYVHIYK